MKWDDLKTGDIIKVTYQEKDELQYNFISEVIKVTCCAGGKYNTIRLSDL